MDERKILAAHIYASTGDKTEAARAAHVHRSTVGRWWAHDPEFRALVERLRADAAELLRQGMLERIGAAWTRFDHIMAVGDDQHAVPLIRWFLAAAIKVFVETPQTSRVDLELERLIDETVRTILRNQGGEDARQS